MTDVPVKPGTEYAALSHVTRQWLLPYTIPVGSKDKVETHMSLAGGPFGRLSIPAEVHESWLAVYANELRTNPYSLFFAERRTAIFRMHFDLDFCQREVVDSLLIMSLARECTTVFRAFFPAALSDDIMWSCVILTSVPKPTVVAPVADDDDGERIKSGCHLIWPWLYVDQIQALQLRANVVDLLARTWPPRPPTANSYDDVVDRTVLTSNGLRMFGSNKAVRCKECKKTTRDRCVACNAIGIIAENRPYLLTSILTPDGEVDAARLADWTSDMFKCVRFTSIRSSRTESTPGFTCPDHAVADSHVKAAARRNMKTQSKAATATAVGIPGAITIDPTFQIFTALSDFLPSLSPHWGGVKISKLFMQRELGKYTVHVVGPGSSFCKHVNRAHGTSSIYFTVERDGVRQACFSPKVHDAVSCRRYVSAPFALSQWLQEAMFGCETQNAAPERRPSPDTDTVLAKSAAYTKLLADRVELRRKQETSETASLKVIGKKPNIRHIIDRGTNVMHPIFTDKTCGEVEQMNSAELHREYVKIREMRLAETSAVHAREVTCNGSVPMQSKSLVKSRQTQRKKRRHSEMC